MTWYLVLLVCMDSSLGYAAKPCVPLSMPGGAFATEAGCHAAYGDLSKYARQLPIYMCMPRADERRSR